MYTYAHVCRCSMLKRRLARIHHENIKKAHFRRIQTHMKTLTQLSSNIHTHVHCLTHTYTYEKMSKVKITHTHTHTHTHTYTCRYLCICPQLQGQYVHRCAMNKSKISKLTHMRTHMQCGEWKSSAPN